MNKRLLYFVAAVAVLAAGLSLACPGPDGTPTSTAPPGIFETEPLASVVAERLEVPWALAFLPGGGIVFTERSGRVRLVDGRGELQAEPLLTVTEVAAVGEGGLLGIALHPDFARNRLVYLYYTYRDPGAPGRLANKVVRFALEGNRLVEPTTIIAGIPGANNHDGGRIKFGPDGLLYLGAGDAANPASAQDRAALSGKILRLNPDGTIPAGNPFPGSPVFSFGHRNPQGLAWDAQGRLWETEHGSNATDEVNLVQPGRNYGWPVVRGDESAPGLAPPVIHSGADTWAPSGIAFLNGSLFFAGLRGQSLFQLTPGDSPALARHLRGDFGRLREVVAGPDGFLYITTNNRDGRGVPVAEDDRIIRINPAKLGR